MIRVRGFAGVYLANDRTNGQGRLGEDGVLEGEGCLGSALPEASEQVYEQANLSEEEGGPDSRLRKHVHGDACGEDDGRRSEDGEKKEDGPSLRKVGAEGSPGRGESATDAPIGLAVMSEMETEFYCVDLNEIEVETKDGRDEEDDDVAE